MSENRKTTDWPIVAGVAVMLLLVAALGLYVVGYFATSTSHSGPIPDSRCRIFRLKWQADIYKPAAKVESVVTGDHVSTHWQP